MFGSSAVPPRGEELIWRPDIQEAKRSESGQANVRYRTG
jgi:spore photoproduct lyase